MNAAVLVYERFIGPSISFGKIVECKFIATIWLVSAVSNIPEIFHVEYTVTPNTTTGHCTQVNYSRYLGKFGVVGFRNAPYSRFNVFNVLFFAGSHIPLSKRIIGI